MTRYSHHITAFVLDLQKDAKLSREEKGRQMFEAIDFLEEVICSYPDPRNDGLDEEDCET